MQYFVIEGIDMSGKTTQHKLLQQQVNAIILDQYQKGEYTKDSILFMSEPSDTKLGNLIRNFILHDTSDIDEYTKFLLFLAQRSEIFNKIASFPHIVIADRSLISGIAYASHLSLQEALYLNLFATLQTLPQKIVFLEISKDELEKRMQYKQLDLIESKGISHLLAIQDRFKEILSYITNNQENSHTNIPQTFTPFYTNIPPELLVIDSSLSPQEIHNKITSFFFET